MPDKIVNHFVLADGSTAKYDAGSLINLDETVSLTGYAPDAKTVKDQLDDLRQADENALSLGAWRNGYIRSTGSVGTIGSDQNHLVAGYDGAYLTIVGDGKQYSVVVDDGWELTWIGKYSNRALASFVEFVSEVNSITLEKDYYYVFQIGKSPTSSVSPSDTTDTTLVVKSVEYYPLLSEIVHSFNWANPEDLTANNGHYINTSGTVGAGGQYSYTDFIPVNAGQTVYILKNGMPDTNARFRYVTAYDDTKTVMQNAGEATTGRIYTVPDGVSYIRVTVFMTDYNAGGYAINVGQMMPYDTYSEERMPAGVGESNESALLLTDMPLETMPSYIKNVLAYRPLANPTKGYMCLVTDDGNADMVTYTIPMVISKNVPCTFAVMSESQCFQTQERTQAVVDAVNNNGCAIAQHGGRNWTEFSEYGLNKYFETEKTFFDGLGVDVKSAVIPSHYTSPLIQAVAGGWFGVVRSGYKGYDANGNYGDTVHNFYDYYTSGEGSNLFGLSSYNLSGRTLAENKLAIDYAHANNKILIVYWHENALDATKKEVMESSIDYAIEKGLEFITLDKIPYLNEGTITF